MKRRIQPLILVAVVLSAVSAPCVTWAQDLRDDCQEAIRLFEATDPGIADRFESAFGYAVFPKVGKGGFGLGGAHGKGLVYRGGDLVGRTSMSQFTVGLQLGGQVYQQVIFFQTQGAFERFTGGNFEFSAQVSAIAAAAGVSKDAKYEHGVLIFTIGKAGLMYEASVGGQKFSYQSL